MARSSLFTGVTAIVCLAASACEEDVRLFTSDPIAVRPLDDAGQPPPEVNDPPAGSARPDASSADPVPTSPVDASAPDDTSTGEPSAPPDAGFVPAPPMAVVAGGPAAPLPRLGVEGGDPRLGICRDGVVIGARTTANPSLEVFGQRLTFVEPICGKVSFQPAPAGVSTGTLRVTRDDASVTWSEADGFFGIPLREVPDPRLIWVLQPETICPEATPVAVGLSGEYDPIAPDVVDTAAIRSLLIECAPLVVAPDGAEVSAAGSGHQLVSNAASFAVSGTETYRSACEDGAVTTQIQVHAGFWLDGFVLGCSRLRVGD